MDVRSLALVIAEPCVKSRACAKRLGGSLVTLVAGLGGWQLRACWSLHQALWNLQ